MFFQTQRVYDDFTGGSQANTEYYKGMLVFTLSKGRLMYEATLSGQKCSFKPIE